MPASVWLVQHALKEKKYVWKRTRHRLRRKRDEQKFRAAQVEIAELVEKSKRGEITLGYVDEAGFAPTQPNRSAWTEQGETHLITAERGKRLNVVAALLSTGALFSARFWETLTAAAFAGFLGLLLKSVGGPLTILLDKASIHKAKAIQPVLALLKQQGLTLIFLPPYRPELNRIEWLWHKMKYDWLPFKARTAEKLHKDVGKILDEFGSVCRMTFC